MDHTSSGVVEIAVTNQRGIVSTQARMGGGAGCDVGIVAAAVGEAMPRVGEVADEIAEVPEGMRPSFYQSRSAAGR